MQTSGIREPMGTTPSDFELMERLRAGDREALADLIRRHQPSLVNFFRRMGARTHETEDLVQDAFLRLYAWRDRWRPTGKFTNLLFVLARHAWADLSRKAARLPRAADNELGVTEAAAAPGTDPDARMDVRQALATLSDKLRMVVVLNVYQGLSYQEIADVLDVPLGTVKSRMHLAMKALKERMNADE